MSSDSSSLRSGAFVRRSGRTTRMLRDAVERASSGGEVVVGCESLAHGRSLAATVLGWGPAQLESVWTGLRPKVLFRSGGSITFVSIQEITSGGLVIGYGPEVEVMADHLALERRWPWIHREIRRAEAPRVSVPEFWL